VYSVIAEPPSAGVTQFMETPLPEIAVIGAAGAEGKVGIIAPLPGGDKAEVP
jgi:hypothetical protein